MKSNHFPDNLSPDTSWLYPLASRLPLSATALETALHNMGVLPNKEIWLNWLMLLLLGLGSGLLLSGVVFFFAYNWEDMHRFTRFGVLAGGIITTAMGAMGLVSISYQVNCY